MASPRPLRVAVMAHSFPRFPGDTNGPFVERLSEELAALGHTVHVLVPWDPELETSRGDSPLAIHSFRYVWPPGWHGLGYSRTLQRDVRLKAAAWLQAPLYFACGVRALRRLVRRERIDLVHAHWILPNGWIASRAAAGEGVPYCVTLHGSDVFMAERNPLFGRLAKRALAGARHVTSCSADLRSRLAAIGAPADGEKIRLVPNGTDLPAPAPAEIRRRARDRWGLPSDTPVVLAVGRLVDKKGFPHLLEALPAVLEAHPSCRLVLGGGGDLEEPLKARARALGIERSVTFTGPLTHPEVLELMAAADLFVMPSIRDRRGNIDGLPVVVLEAMAAGRAVVATDVAGMPLAIDHDVTGLLVPEKDASALAGALRELLDHPDRASTMGEAARRKVAEDLNWAAIARVHDRLYREAAAP